MNKKSKVNKFKKISFIIIPITLSGMIFPFINVINKYNISNEINNVTNKITNRNSNYSSDTSDIVLKQTLPDNSQRFSGQIYHDLINSNGNQFYQNQFFDAFFEIQNPVTNGTIIQKKVECIDYNDAEGKITIETQISPWLNGGTISPTFSPKKTFVIEGFKKYTEATSVTIKQDYPKDKKPSEIYESNITNYISINNLPNAYEIQPKTSYILTPNDNLGILDITVTLSTAVVKNPSNNKFYFQNAPESFNLQIKNLKKQPATILPTKDNPIDGASLDKIAEKVTQIDIKNLIVKNSKPLPSTFDPNYNIFDVVKTETNNDESRVVFNAKIYNIYNQEGLLISDKSNAVSLESITINNLKVPINTSLSLKKQGSNDVLAQTIYETKTDLQIIDEYINVENKPDASHNFSIRIDQKSFDNIRGIITLDLIMRNYYELGSIVNSESRVIRLVISGFKTINESVSIPLKQQKTIYASDVNLTDSNDPNYIGNFIDNQNYPDDTIFSYKALDVNNALGLLKIEVNPSKWFDNRGQLVNSTASNYKKIALIIDDFKIRNETTVVINDETANPEIIQNIYATDVTEEQLKTYIKFNSAPENLNYTIKNIVRRNSSRSISFDVVLNTYYDSKGLISNTPKEVKIIIKGFKYRGKSAFIKKPEILTKIPSDINDSNWQEYIGIDNFPNGTIFKSLSFRPINKDGTLLFSAIPSKIYDVSGDEIENSSNEVFEIFISGMKIKNKTMIKPLIKDSSNESLFNFFPEEIDKKITSSSAKEVLKDYISFINPYSDSIDDYDIVYNNEIDPNTKYNNISGEITFKIILKNYYNELGNPVVNDLNNNYQFYLTVGNFKKVVPNYLITADVNKNLTSIDPYSLISEPKKIIEYITFPDQTDIAPTDYAGPDIEIISISGGSDANSLLDQGLVLVEYKINNYFDSNGNFISKGDNSQNWDVQKFIVGGFKSRINANSDIDFIALISIVLAIVLIVIILIICLGILFRKKKYYINENYDRGLINANETTIPLVIKTNDKLKKSRPKLIPLLKEDKPPKPLKQYKPIKHKEVKVKPPKQPVLPGQRKREFFELLNKFKGETQQKIKKLLDFNKFPINEPFEIDNKWYFKNEKGEYFLANENNEWIATKKPKMKKQKLTKEQKNELKKQKKDKKKQN